MTRRLSFSTIALHIVVISGALLTMLPIVWMIYSSFKTTSEIFRYPPWLPPETWSFSSYTSLMSGWSFRHWYVNSVVYAGVVTVLVIFFCSLAGFAFAKYDFRGKNVLFIILIGSTLIPFQLLLIPLFVLMSRFGWVNSWYSMIIPWVAPAFGIFLMRQFILAVPTEIIESARLDGASELRIYGQIVVPLVRPGMVTLAILTFLGSWNSFIWPLMVLRGDTVITLPVGIAGMGSSTAGSSGIPYGEMMAAATLVSVPIIVLFLMLQRQFISGLTSGSMKA